MCSPVQEIKIFNYFALLFLGSLGDSILLIIIIIWIQILIEFKNQFKYKLKEHSKFQTPVFPHFLLYFNFY